MPDTFKIGSTLGGIQDLPTLFSAPSDVFDPDWSYQPYSTSVRLGNGILKGMGYPVAKWRFNYLTNAQRDILKAFCTTGISGDVYIVTRTNVISGGDLSWVRFAAVMNWTPEDEDKQANNTLGVLVTFTHLVVS